MFSKCGNFVVITGVTVLGCILYYADKKRRLDQCYKHNVDKKRAEIKLKETEEFKHRMLAFPASNEMKHIRKFVIREIQKGEKYLEHKNCNKAIEHFANGLSLIDYDYKLVNNLYKHVPLKMYKDITDQMKEIRTMLPKMKMIKS